MRTRLRKTARMAAWTLGGLALLVCLAVGGALVWLQTGSGQKTVTALIADALREQGILFSVDSLSLSPVRVHLRNLRLADAKGEWLAVNEVDVRIRLSALLHRTVALSLVLADTPELFRVPELPEKEPEPSPAPEPSEGFFSLPVGLSLDALVIKNLAMHADVLFPGKDGNNPSVLAASLAGQAESWPGEALRAFLTLDASVPDMPALKALLETGPLPLTGFASKTEVKASVGKTLEAGAKGTATITAGQESFEAAYRADAALDGSKASLREAVLEGLGLHLLANGDVDLDTLTGKAKATFTTERGGKWRDLAAKALGLTLDGALTANLDAALLPEQAVDAHVSVTGRELTWPEEQLQTAFGRDLSLKAAVTGGGAAPYVMILDTLDAGTLTASGRAELSLAAQTVEAAFRVALENLAPFAPGVSGGVRASAALSGSLAAPSFTVEADSDAITTEAGRFEGLRASVRGAASLADVPGRDAPEQNARGTAGVTLAQSPAGPVAFSTAWAVGKKNDGTVSARVHDVDLNLAGTSLTADVTAVLPGNGAPLSLDGSASASVSSWKSLAALTGVPLSGGKAGFDAVFSHDAQGQNASANLNADRLQLPGAFSLNGLSASLKASDFANPNIDLSVRMGKGEAGPVDWGSGAVTVNAVQGRGTFAVALRTDATARTALTALAKTPPGRPKKEERLSALGSFVLPALARQGTGAPSAGSGTDLSVTLDRLAARAPDSAAGIHLASPATLNLGDAVSLKGLALNVTPGKGSVTCDALFGRREANLTAEARDLPFRLLRDFVDAPVPDGTAAFAASLTRRDASVQGKLTARAVMTPVSLSVTPKPVAFTLDSVLGRDPDPNYPHLTATGGISRLKGTATLGFDKSASAGGGSDKNGSAKNGTGPATGSSVPEAEAAASADPPDMNITFNFPLRFSPDGIPAPDNAAPLAADVRWNGEITPVWALLPLPDRTLSGLARVNATLKGSLARPDYSAEAFIADGKFQDSILGVLLTDIALQAQSASTGESKILLRAEDGQGGSAAVEGRLLPPEKDGPPLIAARGHINRLSPLHRDDLSIRLSGRLDVQGPLAAPKVSADVEVERGELSLLSTLGGGVRTLEITDPEAAVKPPAAGPMLDVRVTVPNRFFIRGRGLDSEWEGELAVTGPASEPSITGSLRPVRGAFNLLTKPFVFQDGDIAFFGGDRINPGLNLTLAYEGPTITALVHARGTASKPTITMESRPPLPQDQIIAAVLFGKSFSELSRFEALQVANSVRELANIGQGGLNPLATMRTALGVDMLRVGSSGASSGDNRSISGAPGAGDIGGGTSSADGDSDQSVTPTLEAGKYINDAIYVGVEQGVSAGSTGVRVEIELRPNLNLQGRTSANSSEVGIGWKNDY